MDTMVTSPLINAKYANLSASLALHISSALLALLIIIDTRILVWSLVPHILSCIMLISIMECVSYNALNLTSDRKLQVDVNFHARPGIMAIWSQESVQNVQ